MDDYVTLTKQQLLDKCEELGINKCKSKNKTQLIMLISEITNEPLKEPYEYLPYSDKCIDTIIDRNFDDLMFKDKVNWDLIPEPLLSVMESVGHRYIVLAKKMKHSLQTQYKSYAHYGGIPKRKHAFDKLVYKYVFDNKLCLDNFYTHLHN